ncbi:hypothetical protein L1987_04808 [Smallanthus sonchifolius]|uniref:Uncharacterized protein n=1 Tax=Smallanthus sonchifolius TaxID=185202 RepID=A0ACB9JTQ9_9ASTR|nr:hypothetical protein L1987_04808 [Smallanthus sonchifolius]
MVILNRGYLLGVLPDSSCNVLGKVVDINSMGNLYVVLRKEGFNEVSIQYVDENMVTGVVLGTGDGDSYRNRSRTKNGRFWLPVVDSSGNRRWPTVVGDGDGKGEIEL